MSLKKRCLELALALASFLPIQANAQPQLNLHSQKITFETKNLGRVQEARQINSLLNTFIDNSQVSSAFQSISKENSLDSFVKNTNNLSNYEKVSLLGRMGSFAGYNLYDANDSVKNADENLFFQNMANSLKIRRNINTGVCRQIHNFVTQTARKWGLPAVSFTDYYRQGGHVSSAVKIYGKWVVVNYGDLFQSKDSNLFAVIDYFQKLDGSANFQNDFFIGRKPSFRRITPDGEIFYDFNIANQGKSVLYNNIIQGKKLINREVSLKISDFEKSALFKNNLYFLKIGEIKGYYSALKKSPMIKIGVNVDERENHADFVFEADITAAKFNQEKLVNDALIANYILGTRMNVFKNNYFADLLFGSDATMKLNDRDNPPDPDFNRVELGFIVGKEKKEENYVYLTASGLLTDDDLLNWNGKGFLKDYNAGVRGEILRIIVNPNINLKPEETRYSLSAELRRTLGNYKIDLSSDIFFTRTNFKDLNPDKKGVNFSLQIAKENKGIRAYYSLENHYWPSKDEKENAGIEFFLNF